MSRHAQEASRSRPSPRKCPHTDQPALDYVLDGDAELRAVEAALREAEITHDAHEIAHGHERLHAIGGYAAAARAARMLDGLGFKPDQIDNPVASFSGGWRMRLNLARVLMTRADLMLLDEPTNHLDIDAVVWLQNWLLAYEGTLLVISHDREFLDAICTHTLHLAESKATLYTGNYSQFERLRAERMAQQAAVSASQQRTIAHLQSFVDRFKASAAKARLAQSRVKMIERIKLVAPVVADSEFSFDFPAPDKLPSPLIRLHDAAVGYGQRTVLSGIKLSLEPGQRIGLVGPNGEGKSTLVKLLAGELDVRAGEMTRHPDLRVGYFAQHQLEQLNPDASPLEHFKELDPKKGEQELRSVLGGFNFVGDRVFEKVAPFSGGEKARLALAMVVYRRPNLLLLDEPTNHLDLDMRQALEIALSDFDGAVVLVSHDRHLVGATCDQLIRVCDGSVGEFDGDPVPRNVDAPTHPDLVEPGDVIEKSLQPGKAAGTPQQARMHAHRHHAWHALAFGIQHVEAVAQIMEKVIGRVEALRRREAHVVGVERVRHDQVRAFAAVGARHSHPERQVVAVVVAVVFEAAVFDDSARVFGLSRPVYQPSGALPVMALWISTARRMCARSRPRACPGSGSSAGRARRSRGRASRQASINCGLRCIAMATPNTVSGRPRRWNSRRMRQHADARSVFVDRLHAHVASRIAGRADDLGQKLFAVARHRHAARRCGRRSVLAALFVQP
jgi:ATPase subunit of ABC transporter with duplicated ATPase domains